MPVPGPPGRTLTSLDIDPDAGDGDGTLEHFDDSGEGIYGLGVREAFTPEVSGVHRLWLGNLDMTPVAFRIAVTTE